MNPLKLVNLLSLGGGNGCRVCAIKGARRRINRRWRLRAKSGDFEEERVVSLRCY
jgi:hypothetical protein